jgi:hypothetical protein
MKVDRFGWSNYTGLKHVYDIRYQGSLAGRALAVKKSLSVLVRESIDDRLDMPASAD